MTGRSFRASVALSPYSTSITVTVVIAKVSGDVPLMWAVTAACPRAKSLSTQVSSRYCIERLLGRQELGTRVFEGNRLGKAEKRNTSSGH